MHPNHVKKRLFVLGNGAAGAENQAIALANRLKKRLINRGIDSEIQFQSVTLQQSKFHNPC
jgi:hypothetical protein